MTVEYLKALRKEKKRSFNAYASRRDAVKKIVTAIDDKLDDEISAVNKRISNCISELQQGLKGGNKTTTVCSDLESRKEKGTGSDSNMSSCRSNLKSEQSRCQKRINALDAEIKDLERQIRDLGGSIYFWE